MTDDQLAAVVELAAAAGMTVEMNEDGDARLVKAGGELWAAKCFASRSGWLDLADVHIVLRGPPPLN